MRFLPVLTPAESEGKAPIPVHNQAQKPNQPSLSDVLEPRVLVPALEESPEVASLSPDPGTTCMVLKDFGLKKWFKPRPESGLDWLFVLSSLDSGLFDVLEPRVLILALEEILSRRVFTKKS